MKYIAILDGATVANVIVAADDAVTEPGQVDVSGLRPRPGPGWVTSGNGGFDPPATVALAAPAWRAVLQEWLAANPTGGLLTIDVALALVQAALDAP